MKKSLLFHHLHVFQPFAHVFAHKCRIFAFVEIFEHFPCFFLGQFRLFIVFERTASGGEFLGQLGNTYFYFFSTKYLQHFPILRIGLFALQLFELTPVLQHAFWAGLNPFS